MQHALNRTLSIVLLSLLPVVSLCPCGMIGSTGEITGGLQQAIEKEHCHDHAGGSSQAGPEHPCGSETCHYCSTDLVGVPHASSTSTLTLTVLQVYGGFSSTPLPAPSAARAECVAGDLPPPNLSRPILELNRCFLI